MLVSHQLQRNIALVMGALAIIIGCFGQEFNWTVPGGGKAKAGGKWSGRAFFIGGGLFFIWCYFHS